MKCIILLFFTVSLIACYKPYRNPHPAPTQKVWGSKPVYAAIDDAMEILYDPHKHPVLKPGNIYAYYNFIFQVDVGTGIHIIDNSIPASAARIGFIKLNACEQISIKGAYLYTNSYADLVTLDISNPEQMKIVSRIPGAFPEFQYNYPMAQPAENGPYTCPRTDSIVIRWEKDSIEMTCFK